MRVVLFRHGPAASRDASIWPDDRLRPLTPRGMERTRAAALGLRRLVKGKVDAILTSPLLRATQTAEIAANALDAPQCQELAGLAPEGSYRRVIQALRERDAQATVVLVGHEPDLGKLGGVLVFGAPHPLRLRKGGACAVSFDELPDSGGGTLEWLVPPRLLRRLSGKKAAR
jgi:phosphohistidine phosphatase